MFGILLNFPDGFATTTLAYAGVLLSDFLPLILLVVGTLLAVTAIAVVIRVFLPH